jgi:hypothetical protein
LEGQVTLPFVALDLGHRNGEPARAIIEQTVIDRSSARLANYCSMLRCMKRHHWRRSDWHPHGEATVDESRRGNADH